MISENRFNSPVCERGDVTSLTVVRLIHNAEDDVCVRAVLLCERRPQLGELCIRRTTLTNYPTVPACLQSPWD